MKLVAMLVVFAVVAAACGGDDGGELTIDEYATLLQAVEAKYQDEAADAGDEDSRDRYPLGGDLVAATELYTAIDSRLAGWKALEPPAEVREHHARLVAALDELQDKVGEYLMDEAFTGEDFDFNTIGPLVTPEILDAVAACRDLRSALDEAGTPVRFAGDCEF